MTLTEFVKVSQHLAGEVANLEVVALFLKLVDDHYRNDYLVLFKSKEGLWVRK